MRTPYIFTPARRRALDAARRKRTFRMTPAKRAALRKATEANRRNFRLTPARLRAMHANALKMQRASVEKFRMTEARREASERNLRKALATPRTPESRLRSRFNHLQHGLQVRSLDETMVLLGEDPKELEAHRERFRRVFAPSGPAEEKVVRALAEAVWRRLRLFRAQAVRESKQLKKLFEFAPPVSGLDAEMTRSRLLILLTALTDRDRFIQLDQELIAAVEREARMLLRLRSEGRERIQLYSRDSRKTWRRYLQLERELNAERREIQETEDNLELFERLRKGGPEVERALETVRRQMGRP
jgi:hypothetical protein